jgi:hypothetical protein
MIDWIIREINGNSSLRERFQKLANVHSSEQQLAEALQDWFHSVYENCRVEVNEGEYGHYAIEGLLDTMIWRSIVGISNDEWLTIASHIRSNRSK